MEVEPGHVLIVDLVALIPLDKLIDRPEDQVGLSAHGTFPEVRLLQEHTYSAGKSDRKLSLNVADAHHGCLLVCLELGE